MEEDDPRRPSASPDSLTGKLDAIFDADADSAAGVDEGEGDAGETPGEELPPKRPTDPPF